MRALLLIGLVLLGPLCLSGRGDAASFSLTLASLNLQNYNAMNRITVTGYRTDYPKSSRETASLRRVIQMADPDCLVLQEIGGLGHLRELQRDLAAEGLHYPYALVCSGPDTERQTAVLSRYFLIDQCVPFRKTGYPEPDSMVRRGLLRVWMRTPVGLVEVMGVHLKSRIEATPEDPGAVRQREAEWDAVLAELEAADASGTSLRLLLGDFNADFAEAPQRNGDALSLPRGWTRLNPVASDGSAWTASWNRKQGSKRVIVRERVDHILFQTESECAAVARKTWLVDCAGSDHRLVAATFDLEVPE